MWKDIQSLKEPFNDAVNYKSKSEKEFFSKIFQRTEQLKECLSPATYYLMGEKGTGKTAYAVYLENNTTNNTRCKLTTMTETQYKRFIELKTQGRLAYSDYANIWRSILLFVASQMLIEKSKSFYHSFTGKFAKVESAISKWNNNALNPEVESAFEALNSDALSVKVKNNNIGEVGGEQRHQEIEKISKIRHHLLETENALKDAISDLKIKHNHILFIDGIDFRPEAVKYADYIECIKGLSEASWQLNTEFFNNIKDSSGRIKIVLLIRPDVFHKLNLYNSNSRLQDNCVYLDWSTTEKEYPTSNLYDASGRYFAIQQKNHTENQDAFNHYFNGHSEANAVFKRLLRISFQKPRDILTFIKLAIKDKVKNKNGHDAQFDKNIISSPSITRQYSDYLLGEVKNYASFYMTPIDFANYLKFFQYLDGKQKFSMTDCEAAFTKFKNWAEGENIMAKDYMRDAESLLQFFYETNVIGYHETAVKDGADFYHWAYRERSVNNLAPKIKTEGVLMLNPGISKALDIGKETASQGNKTQQTQQIQRQKPKHPGRKKTPRGRSLPPQQRN